jgi:hypothetical protein
MASRKDCVNRYDEMENKGVWDLSTVREKRNAIGQCDAKAYVQSKLGGILTWVTLPREHWPKHFESFRSPVVILKLSLYGHPVAGGYWEAHRKSKLEKAGFEAVDDWTSDSGTQS